MKQVYKIVVMAICFVILLVCAIIMSPLLAFAVLKEANERDNQERITEI